MHYTRKVIMVLALLLPALGCDEEENGVDLAKESEQIVGLYAQRTRVALITTIPSMAMSFPSTTTSYGFAEISLVNGALEFKEWFCHIDYESTESPMPVTIPDPVTATIQATAPLQVREEGGEAVFHRPIVPIGVGVKLELLGSDPVNDPLPTEADDPAVWDQDGDGNPGVTTILPDVGELYSVRRERYTFDLRWDDDTHESLSGLFTDTSQESVLSASTEALLEIDLEYGADPDPSKSTMVLVRLDEAYDCARLMAEKDALYP